MNSVQYARGSRIVELMRRPTAQRDTEWVRDALQQAILLELATLPPYLCGMWSINATSGDPVFRTLRAIVFDEMSHLGITCNLLTAVGGTPRIADEALVPTYPGPLPGGVRPELTVFLSGLQDSVRMYAGIEKPDAPVTRTAQASHTSIGAFYTAVQDALCADSKMITGDERRQVTRDMEHHGSGNSLTPLTTLDSATSAVAIIKEQGEGTSASPQNPHPAASGELANYYAFLEILHKHKLVERPGPPATWAFEGPPVPMPPILPMGVVPEGGWPRSGPASPPPDVITLLDKANRAYSDMLRLLEQVWQQDDPDQATRLLDEAVWKMAALRGPARELMKHALPDGSGKNYGPEFRYTAL
ncbi:ferritin-like protein [Streptomyces sp. MUM 203J]|uniref:ferritin-like domain-containing protein n=1 Tax=Streptomyces sp. MUM 203J TaxID=2791990 RepID=UPI001F03D6D9|nr:ferritin-like protein [Streptomyces sp. MUM 203J]MCH0542097.1 ferritin-like protein [Streptomyces sp. MUM 203J]